MTVFLVIGGIGLVLLVLSLVVGEIFESLEIGDGGISGMAVGIGAVVFGASGVLALSADLAVVWAYVIAVAFALLAGGVAQLVINRLAASEDPAPPPLEGAFGVLTATTGPEGGEVRLEGVRDLESRLAWADEPIPAGTRVVVVAVSGSRVHVTRA
ncbi:NfeD family protein [Cellulomonas massiliensis]|uniref:NfeD family protein n=1 Tax=Cellulomonas massiliensis TaxID=1465811 RepID=UPI00031B9824|nr:NfeD family protein [Cellulomonas massiliensis]